MTKRILSLVVSAALLLCLLPTAILPVSAEENQYIDFDEYTGEQIFRTIPDTAVELTTGKPGNPVTLTGGFYTVAGTTHIDEIICSGDTNIILTDKSHLLLDTGIFLDEGVNLTIFAQSTENSKGMLIVENEETVDNAGIHALEGTTCGNITINGGLLEVKGGSENIIGAQKNSNCGNIVINGGQVEITADSHSCVGIGASDGGTCGDIICNGGFIRFDERNIDVGLGANDEGTCGNIVNNGADIQITFEIKYAVPIGARLYGTCGNILLNGGITETLTKGTDGTCIGACYHATCQDIVINGGTVTASFYDEFISSNYLPIGASINSSCGNIAINGGELFAQSTGNTPAIGAFNESTCKNISIEDNMSTIVTLGDCSALGAKSGSQCGTISVDKDLYFYTGSLLEGKPDVRRVENYQGESVVVTTNQEPTYLEPTCTAPGIKPYVRGMFNLYLEAEMGGKLIDSIDEWTVTDGRIPPIPHSYGYKDESTHICAFCGAEENHNIQDGKCICGLTDNFTYYDYDNEEDDFVEKTAPGDFKILSTATPYSSVMEGGYYVIYGTVKRNERLNFEDDVHLIFTEGARLVATEGINLGNDVSLTIYNESLDEGKVGTLEIKNPPEHCAAIGSQENNTAKNITLNGGNYILKGNFSAAIGCGYYSNCGDITINGANINAEGSDAAAIGGGDGSNTCGNITINKSIIKASPGYDAPAIGSGYDPVSLSSKCGDILIKSSDVYAWRESEEKGYAASIGSGPYTSCGNITIIDSEIEANGIGGAAIGTSEASSTCGAITISESKITATECMDVAIGSAGNGYCGDISLYDTYVDAIGGDSCVAIGTGYPSSIPDGETAPNILIDGGTIHAQGGDSAPAIGSSFYSTCGNITIKNADVTAYGSDNGSGIGTGFDASCGDIFLSDSAIVASAGKNNGSGIGTGLNGSCGDISISGGTITATGGNTGPGIGACFSGSCGNISISGGTVTATGGNKAPGIGSAFSSSCKDITISGGNITTTGGLNYAGIGCGDAGTCEDICIEGGTVIATGGAGAPGIGEGSISSHCDSITIRGGNVTAIGGSNCAGIASITLAPIDLEGGNIITIGAEGNPGIRYTETRGTHQLTMNEDFLIYAGTKNEDIKRTMTLGTDPYVELFMADINDNPATCLESGYKPYCKNPIDSLYYGTYENGTLIGDTNALNIWLLSAEGGYLPAIGHNWVSISDTEHKCSNCEETGNHTDEDKNYYCDTCPYIYISSARSDAKAPIAEIVGDNPSETVKGVRDINYALIDAETTPETIFVISDSAVAIIANIQETEAKEAAKEALKEKKEEAIAQMQELAADDDSDTMQTLLDTCKTNINNAENMTVLETVIDECESLIKAQYETDLQNFIKSALSTLEPLVNTFTDTKILETLNIDLDILKNLETLKAAHDGTNYICAKVFLLEDWLKAYDKYTTEEAKDAIDEAIEYTLNADIEEISNIKSDWEYNIYQAELNSLISDAIVDLEYEAGKNPSDAVKALLETYSNMIYAETNIDQMLAIKEQAIAAIHNQTIKEAEEAKEALESYRQEALTFIHNNFHEFYGNTLYKLVDKYNALVKQAKSIEEIDNIMDEGCPLMFDAYAKEFNDNIEDTKNSFEQAGKILLTEEITEKIIADFEEKVANAESYIEVEDLVNQMWQKIDAISTLLTQGKNYSSTEAKNEIDNGISEILERPYYETETIRDEYIDKAYNAELENVKKAAKETLIAAADGKEELSETLKAILEANLALIDATNEIEMVQSILDNAVSIIEALAKETVLYGDVNGDGSIDMKDVLLLRRYATGQTQEGFIEKAADVNEDNIVDMKDILMLRKIIATAE